MPAESGGFGALVVVGPSILGAALAAPLSEATHDALEFAKPYADGRWLWLKVTEPGIVDDIQTLVLLKSPPPRNVGTGTGDRSERKPVSTF
jgi:hypothetical protein